MKKTAQVLLLAASFWLLAVPKTTLAQGEECVLSSDTTIVTTLTSKVINFTITNNRASDINYIKISIPDNSFFTITAANADGWDTGYDNSYAEATGSLGVGESMILSVSTNTSSIEGSSSWSAETTSNYNLVCNPEIGIYVSGSQEIPPVISNMQLSSGSTSATISFITDTASTTSVSYGTTTGYGSTTTGASGTSHTLTMSSLSASTTYHYKVSATNANGTTNTSDYTFTTGAAGATTTVTTKVTTTVTNTKTTTNTVTLTDTTPPNVRFLDEFEKIYEEAPLVNLKATDGSGIARLEYTIDGKNFLPIDVEDNFGKKTITTNFVPDITEDGDYTLIVRATDTSGNKVNSKKVEFTIDRLPPRVGPLTVMAGPLIIGAGVANKMELLAGVEYKFILSSAGGPNKIILSCNDTVYDFIKNPDIGVWTTKIKFIESGSCTPEITAVDGADNTQTVNGEQLSVNRFGQIKNSTITAYWYDEYEKKFVKWDGEPYGQINPVITNDLGGYSFLLPKGKYYLEAKAVGKRTSVSNILDIDETSYINDDWELSPSWKFWQIRDEKIINPGKLGNSTWKEVNFALPKANLVNLSTLDIRGKNSVIGLLSSWHPTTNDYLKVMDDLSKNKYNVFPILVQENSSASTSIKARGGYDLNIYADYDGEMLIDTPILGLPTTWVVNRFGQVVKQKVGEVSFEEMVDVINSVD